MRTPVYLRTVFAICEELDKEVGTPDDLDRQWDPNPQVELNYYAIFLQLIRV